MKLSIAITLLILATSYAYRILCIQHLPTKSHYILMLGIVKHLLEDGHEVTMITIYPDKKPIKNFRIIDMSAFQDKIENINILDPGTLKSHVVKEYNSDMLSGIIQNPEVKELLNTEHFHAVISEWFFSDVEAGYAAALQIPWILLHGEMSPHMEYLVDSVHSISTIPMMINDVPIPMTLIQRLKNTMFYLLTTYEYWNDYTECEAEYEKNFRPIAEGRGVTLPPFSEAIHNISVLFLNSHPSFTPARTLPPNAVEIGGYHINEDIPPLPEDLQEILDSSKNGVIYFSFGSLIKSKFLPDKTKKELVKLFGELQCTVLWKFEDQIENLPKNLHVRAWMPQASILSHPNVKVFITHGGALSIIESLWFGKPILAIPYFGDQPINAEMAVQAGRALRITFSADMAGEMRVALKEMLNNDSYHERAQELSRIFRKRPLSPGKLIQNYVKLAIESKGAYHLRSKAQLYRWYEIWMVDQVAVLLVALYVIYRILKKAVAVVQGKFSNKVKTQ